MRYRDAPVLTLMLLVCVTAPQARSADALEHTVLLEQAAYPVPGILSLPPLSKPTPAVLLLHGTASHKDEVGDLYRRLAATLAREGIASLRIDFAGSGDSPVDYRQYTLSSARRDAATALAFLRQHAAVDESRLAVAGFSQGGLIAQQLVVSDPDVSTLVTWSSVAGDGIGSFADFFAQHYADAQANGFARVSFSWRPALDFDIAWFEEIQQQKTLSAMADYQGAVLAIAGMADKTVPYEQSITLVAQSPNVNSRVVLLADADHTFSVLSPKAVERPSHEQLLQITAGWLATQLSGVRNRSPAPQE